MANSVQYIRFKPGCLVELSEELRIAILSVLVALVVDYVTRSSDSDKDDLIRWGSTTLRRIGKLLAYVYSVL